MMDSSAQKVD